MRHHRRLAPILTAVVALSVAVAGAATGHAATTRDRGVAAARQPAATVDWQAVGAALGRAGQLMPGDVYRVGLPRTDLTVAVRGVPLQPTFALGSYAAFKQLDTGPEAMVMGDLVLLDAEVPAVMDGLVAGGFDITALHNHLNEMTPHVMYLHYLGHGDPVVLASDLHAALAASGTPFAAAPAGAKGGPALDAAPLNAILGRNGLVNDAGVYQLSVPRAETVTEMGVPLLPAMGVATVVNMEPLGDGTAAVTGDFVLTAGEVNPVARTLRAGGIDVTALHNHALGDEPRLFYMHFWATGDAADLARGLRAALDLTNSARPAP